MLACNLDVYRMDECVRMFEGCWTLVRLPLSLSISLSVALARCRTEKAGDISPVMSRCFVHCLGAHTSNGQSARHRNEASFSSEVESRPSSASSRVKLSRYVGVFHLHSIIREGVHYCASYDFIFISRVEMLLG